MTTETAATPAAPRAPELAGQIVVVIGGRAGIGLETGRRARAEGADVVLAARNPERLEQAAVELGAQSTAAFDANDPVSLERFFEDMPTLIDHVMVTGPGPHYKPPLEMDAEEARAALSEQMLLALAVARDARGRVRPGGSLVFIGGTAGRRIRPGGAIVSAVTAGMPALTASLALELAPIRVNLIAPGFVDTPLSASLLGDDLDRRREELRSTLPIGRVVGPADVAALAIHLMINTAVTGATYDIDGGQQFVT
jgi:NAD(P)-dependent dehydrogenase (short-subunit alcohol dehydrogenase family)